MHNYHTEDYYFHANGDPIPGDVLIKKVGSDLDAFRSTAEEITTFCAASRLEAIGSVVELRTTRFEITDDIVTLTALDPQKHDALTIAVPLTDLQGFAGLALQRRFQSYLEDCMSGDTASETMAGIGLFADLRKWKT